MTQFFGAGGLDRKAVYWFLRNLLMKNISNFRNGSPLTKKDKNFGELKFFKLFIFFPFFAKFCKQNEILQNGVFLENIKALKDI